MPLYECLTTAGTLDDEGRRAIAQAITTIHCEETGAPQQFVNVLFPELPRNHTFVAGEVATQAFVRGSIRRGRSEAVRAAIIRRIFDAYKRVTGLEAMQIVVTVGDVPAHWIMEGGQMLPEPNADAEAAWFSRSKIGPAR